jgi:hypothetical protein
VSLMATGTAARAWGVAGSACSTLRAAQARVSCWRAGGRHQACA